MVITNSNGIVFLIAFFNVFFVVFIIFPLFCSIGLGLAPTAHGLYEAVHGICGIVDAQKILGSTW